MTTLESFLNKHVIVRHDMMGVLFGVLNSVDSQFLTLTDVRHVFEFDCEKGVNLSDFAVCPKFPGTRLTAKNPAIAVPINTSLCGIITVDDQKVIDTLYNAPVSHQD